jgi:3-carboxy-cis,cis-muconate cycloisomerase
VDGLQIDTGRMRANLDQSGGLLMAEALTMALAPHLGRPEAQGLVQNVAARVRKGVAGLRQAALDEPRITAVLGPDAIDRALDPACYLGSAHALIDRALAAFRTL